MSDCRLELRDLIPKHLAPEQLRTVGDLGSYVTRDKGEVLFSQGDAADAFYVLLQGRVEVWIDRSMGLEGHWQVNNALANGPLGGALSEPSVGFKMVSLASTLGPGDHIGESALIVEGGRSATAKARAAARVARAAARAPLQ